MENVLNSYPTPVQNQTQVRTTITAGAIATGLSAGGHLASNGAPSAQQLHQALNMPFISSTRALIGNVLLSAGELLHDGKAKFFEPTGMPYDTSGTSEWGAELQFLGATLISYDTAVKAGVTPIQNADGFESLEHS